MGERAFGWVLATCLVACGGKAAVGEGVGGGGGSTGAGGGGGGTTTSASTSTATTTTSGTVTGTTTSTTWTTSTSTATTTTTTTVTADPECCSCAEFITPGVGCSEDEPFCPGSEEKLDAVATCVCGNDAFPGNCPDPCSLTCTGEGEDGDCQDCAVTNCGTEFGDCANDS